MASYSFQRPHRTSLRHNNDRRGAVIVFAAFLMVALLAMVAFAVDVGCLLLARTELQRSADAAALAAAWELAAQGDPDALDAQTRDAATHFAGVNLVFNDSPSLNRNVNNSSDGDIVLGSIDDFSDPASFRTNDPANRNAVKVRIRRAKDENGELPLFFARVLGFDRAAMSASAIAALVKDVGGFRTPSTGENLPILPITLEADAWQDLMAGNATDDDWSWNEADGVVEAGGDGIAELLLYPESNKSPGNFGTVDIGPSSNSTQHLSEQILNGVSESDLAHHGGELALDSNGELPLGGDTGISAGIKDALEAIVGESRIIPVYQEVAGNGNNAVYTIVKFVGVRIMEVDLQGGSKGLIIQPANLVTKGTIPAGGGDTSDYVYSPAYLVK